MFIVIFWVCLLLILYTYLGYPALLVLMGKFVNRKFIKFEIFPNVSLIIAAYNEEKSIEKKIRNCLELNYPKEKMEIIVASDCSTDNTNEIVKRFEKENIRLIITQKRSGKTAGRNRVIPEAKGDIIVLTDATGIYHKDAVKKLVSNFADKRVGCVGGVLKYVNPTDSVVGSGEGLYWQYEVLIRKRESQLGNLTAVSGTIYAFRRDLFRNIPEELADDLIMPLVIKELGYYGLFEPEAVCIEEAAREDKEEFNKRVRIANRNILGLVYMRKLLNVFKYGMFSTQLFSHKILRLLMPILIALLFISNLFIISKSSLYAYFLYNQFVFYLLGTAGYVVQRFLNKRNKFCCVPLFFCLTNIGVFVGLIKFLKGQKKAIWEPVR